MNTSVRILSLSAILACLTLSPEEVAAYFRKQQSGTPTTPAKPGPPPAPDPASAPVAKVDIVETLNVPYAAIGMREVEPANASQGALLEWAGCYLRLRKAPGEKPATVTGSLMKQMLASNGYRWFSLWFNNLAAISERLVKAGYPAPVRGANVGMTRDPENNVVEIMGIPRSASAETFTWGMGVSDDAAARKFHGETLGSAEFDPWNLPPPYSTKMYLFATGTGRVKFTSPRGRRPREADAGPDAPGLRSVTLRVADLAAARAGLTKRGAQIEGDKRLFVTRHAQMSGGQSNPNDQKLGNGLYLSNGAWDVFRDVSAKMGIQNEKAYNRQPSFGDVNKDGHLDIAKGDGTFELKPKVNRLLGTIRTLLLLLTVTAARAAEPAPAADPLFKRFDKDNDGRVTAEELGMPAAFKAADKNGDGFVTSDEFAAYLEQRPGQRRGRTGQRRTPFQVAAPEDLVVKRGIRYRETPGVEANLQSLDIYAPQDAKDLPVMIYIHGGGWQGGDKAAIGSKPAYFCSRGWVFVSLNYRLVPAVDLLTQLQDSADAIAWVHAHIVDHGGDPQRLHLMGHSAGAHHVAILATNDRFLKAAGMDLSILKSVVELDTQALDVPRMMQSSETAVYVQAFGKDASLWREVSPLHHVVKGKGIPSFFLVVADNREQKLQQAAAFQKALHAAGARCQFVEAPEHDHGSLNRAIGEPGDKVTAAMEQFLTEIEPGMKAPARDQPAPASTGPKDAARSPLSGSELHDIVKQYAALGDHRTGSEVDRRTADWLASLLRQAGLQVEIQDFEVPQFQLRAASLKIAGQNVECFPVWPPKATERPVVAPLTVASAASLYGKIALITENPRLRRDEVVLLQRLVAAGAAGAVILDARGEGTIHAPNVPRMGEPPEIPMLYGANNDRESLSSAAQRGDEVELFIDGEFQPHAKARNVVATLERGPKRIVVSTPYSGWFRCGGERGSGLAMFVALARWAASHETEFSYTFVANSAHELGYAGMTAFLEHQAPEPGAVVCWLHLGANVALLLEARPADGARATRLFTTNPAWEPLLTSLFRDVPWVRVSGGREPSGELALVAPKGYTALNLAGGGNRWMHSPQDGPETTGPDVLQPLAHALAACLEAVEAHQP